MVPRKQVQVLKHTETKKPKEKKKKMKKTEKMQQLHLKNNVFEQCMQRCIQTVQMAA